AKRPETLSRVGIGGERVAVDGLGERRVAAGKAGAANLRTVSSGPARRRGRSLPVPSSPWGPCPPGGILVVPPRPETPSRVGFLAGPGSTLVGHARVYFVTSKRAGYALFSMTANERAAIGLTDDQKRVHVLERVGAEWR